MTISRDELLRERICAARADLAKISELLAKLADNPPPAGDEQEKMVRIMENTMPWYAHAVRRLQQFVKEDAP
jgi:hypothetical protein